MLEQERQIHPKLTPNPSVPSPILSSFGSLGGRKPPRSRRICTQQHPDTAQCSEHPQEDPTPPKHPPASPNPQGPARSTLRDPEHSQSIPGAEPRSSTFPPGLTCADERGGIPTAGLGGEGLARAGEGSPGTGTRGASWGHPVPAPPAGRGREGARKSGCGLQSPRGKDVTPRVGPARAGGCGHPPGRVAGCQRAASCPGGSPRLGPSGGPAEQLRARAGVAPKAEVTANLVPGLPPPGHGVGMAREGTRMP